MFPVSDELVKVVVTPLATTSVPAPKAVEATAYVVPFIGVGAVTLVLLTTI